MSELKELVIPKSAIFTDNDLEIAHQANLETIEELEEHFDKPIQEITYNRVKHIKYLIYVLAKQVNKDVKIETIHNLLDREIALGSFEEFGERFRKVMEGNLNRAQRRAQNKKK